MRPGRIIFLSAITTVAGAWLARKFNVRAPGFND